MRIHFLSSVVLGAVVMSVALFSQPAAALAQGTTAAPVYRFYYHADWEGPHLYRTVPNVPGAGWQTEGTAFYISPVQLPYTVPLYCVYYWLREDHFYTVDIGARDNCVANLGYVDQGVFGYVLPPDKDFPGTAPLYRWVRAYKAGEHLLQDHFYQTSASPVADYNSEGIECRVWTEPLKLPQRLIELTAPAAGTTMHVNYMPAITWKVWSGGGSIRISYSKDNGASWRPIATVANKGNYGDINDQSYNNWKVPVEAVGKIRIKVDWLKGTPPSQQTPNVPIPQPSASVLPWATDTSGLLTVQNIDIRVRPRFPNP